ncbi:selenium-dependent molybdenum cofactor biosynthesis protein YqeB [Azotosporobacter soli]|uniref:selenium-dependent molybdenum cofactor biosynthesis protein YqeB n=1 Tax=Azotosporobacter soli TaxID=3055040 RepID=UPI0031FF3382
MKQQLILIKGAGDMASGIACRLFHSGFSVVMTDLAAPTVIRRTVSFAQAVFEGSMTVEGIRGRLAVLSEIEKVIRAGEIPVVVDPDGAAAALLKPWAVVDAILAKKNLGTERMQAEIVIGVGPGFTAGEDVDAVIETKRGHYLGQVILEGSAIPNTGIPGEVGGYTIERVIRSPRAGVFKSDRKIGALVQAGDVLGWVDEEPVLATISGVLRGLLQDGLSVPADFKIGDIDPRCAVEHCFTVSDKARAIGGGVLEALLRLAREKRTKNWGVKQDGR